MSFTADTMFPGDLFDAASRFAAHAATPAAAEGDTTPAPPPARPPLPSHPSFFFHVFDGLHHSFLLLDF